MENVTLWVVTETVGIASLILLLYASLRAENEKGLQRCQNFERLPLASWTCYDSKLSQTCFPLIFLNRSVKYTFEQSFVALLIFSTQRKRKL